MQHLQNCKIKRTVILHKKIKITQNYYFLFDRAINYYKLANSNYLKGSSDAKFTLQVVWT